MAITAKVAAPKLIKAVSVTRPDWAFFNAELERGVTDELLKTPLIADNCARACTKSITLLPRTSVAPHTGIGLPMLNVDGYRTINAYIISDPLNSTNQRGFTLELSFALGSSVIGQENEGETSAFFDLDNYYDPGHSEHGLLLAQTSDRLASGALPWIGGNHLSHILRAPVMGPYVRASVFNEDSAARSVMVKAYLST